MYFSSFPEDHPLQKALDYSINTGGVHSLNTPATNRFRDVFLNGAIYMAFKHLVHMINEVGNRFHGIGAQSSDTVALDMGAMVVRKGIPWAEEYKNIML